MDEVTKIVSDVNAENTWPLIEPSLCKPDERKYKTFVLIVPGGGSSIRQYMCVKGTGSKIKGSWSGYRDMTDENPWGGCKVRNPETMACNCPSSYSDTPVGHYWLSGFYSPERLYLCTR